MKDWLEKNWDYLSVAFAPLASQTFVSDNANWWVI